MYDPIVGRFLEEDPIGFSAGDTNLYRYVNNSPNNLTDPMGTASSEYGGFLGPLTRRIVVQQAKAIKLFSEALAKARILLQNPAVTFEQKRFLKESIRILMELLGPLASFFLTTLPLNEANA